MTTIKQAFNIFKVTFKDTFYNTLEKLGAKKKKEENIALGANSKKKASKIAIGVLIAIGIAAIMFYIAMFSAMFTQTCVANGIHEEVLYLFLAMAQFIVVFFGSAALLSYLYFSKDNMLLATLPVNPKSIFMAKYAMAYISEYLLCLFISLPMIITYGIVASSMGIAISWSFYVYAVLCSFLLPVLPLLLASIISIPLMYLVSFLKKRTLGNTIVIGIITIAVVALYLVFIGSVSGMQQNTDELGVVVLSQPILNMIISVKKYTIFNYNIVNALLGNKSFLNFILYVLGLIIVFGIAVFISAGFYNKGMRVTLEGSGTSPKNKNYKTSYVSSTFTKSFVIKEFKNIIHTPQLFMSAFMGLIFIPLFAVIFGKSMSFSEAGNTIGNDLGMIGMVLYMSSIMISSGNTIAMVGFSMEGKNLYLLKTLPITAKDIIKPKLIVSNLIGLILALAAAISILAVSAFHNVFIAFLVLILLVLGSIGSTSQGLYNDLKNPNLHFKNVTELTKNNKRLIKPMLTSVGIGLYYMILGIVFSIVSDETFPAIYKYAVFFGIGFLINGLFAYLNWKALTQKAEERYESIEV
jgi:ABC-2 type transport system permease protein